MNMKRRGRNSRASEDKKRVQELPLDNVRAPNYREKIEVEKDK